MDGSKIKAFIGSDDQRLFSSPSELQNSERYLKYAEKPSHILSLLCWTGLLEDSDKTSRKRIISRILPVLLILFTVDVIVTSLIPVNMDFFSTLISLCSYIMSVPIWFAMRRRRKQLTAFLRLLHEIHRQAMTWKISLSLYGICISPVIFAALDAFTSNRAKLTTQLAYGYAIENLYAQLVLIFSKGVLYSTIYPTCPTIVAFLLCLFCQRICDQIRSLTLSIEKCSPKQFTVSFQTNILNQTRRIDDAMFLLQRVFYFPSFLICAASFCSCCTLIAWILKCSDYSEELAMILTFFLYFFMCGVSLLACLWTAGGLPVELEAFNEEFHKKAQLRLLINARRDEIDFEKLLSGRPLFVLTGCDIIHFKRGVILTLAAAILTYTLLILKM
ncbi:hypothetical protein AVEN_229744-1 [Araneus ventricosus]|uniref:Gustatory receptor n=1 Tax=Araneus ventricosus TaxID=182803 RepID=A0A4Y2CE04_ARAVE|nr:hypothetical protein AVEN_229744-1 [Araneus ventricosus]